MAKTAKKKPESKLKTATGPVFVDCEQGSEEWFKARLGLPTASNFATIMASGRDGGDSSGRTSLLHTLAGEIITGEPAEEKFASRAMERGRTMEADARADYERRRGVEVQRVGFAKNFDGLKHCGASPDGLVDFDGVIEIKTMRPDLMIPRLIAPPAMPPVHRAQVQGNLWVLDRDWCDFKIFWPRMPDFTVRIRRDEAFIKDISNAVETFNYDLKQLVQRLRAMGVGEP